MSAARRISVQRPLPVEVKRRGEPVGIDSLHRVTGSCHRREAEMFLCRRALGGPGDPSANQISVKNLTQAL